MTIGTMWALKATEASSAYLHTSTKYQVIKTRYSQEFSRSAQLSGFTGDTNETHKNVQTSLFKATRYV